MARKQKSTLALILLILVVAAILRIWGLDKVPPELFGDELDVGYHAYSLLKTGKDYSGQLLPTYIHTLSEWRTPLLAYIAVPFTWLFGLNEWGVRFAPAFFGVVDIVLFYILLKINFSKRIALLGSAVLTIVPWHLHYSRIGFEATILLALIFGGTIAFNKGLGKPLWLYVSSILFALTFYTYNTANIFVPLLIICLVALNYRVIKSTPIIHRVLSVVLFMTVSLPIGYHIIFGAAAERYAEFSLFNDEKVISTINERRSISDDTVEIVFHNKPIYWLRNALGNYATSISPQFLFIDGDVTFRHSIHEIGPLYWIMSPLILYGLYRLVVSKNKAGLFWIVWGLIAPIPAALTRDGQIHATRLFLLLPALVVFCAVGLDALLSVKSRIKYVAAVLIAVIFFGEFVLYQHRYWVHYPYESWNWWHYGYKEAISYMHENEENYDLIIMNDSYEPVLTRFLFWWAYPPEKFIPEFKNMTRSENILPNFDGFTLDNRYYFGILDEDVGVQDFVKPNMLYLVSQRDEVAGDWDWEIDPPSEIRVLKTIRSPNGQPIFYVVTGQP